MEEHRVEFIQVEDEKATFKVYITENIQEYFEYHISEIFAYIKGTPEEGA